jgi:uncharacterized lipoprotein YajG
MNKFAKILLIFSVLMLSACQNTNPATVKNAAEEEKLEKANSSSKININVVDGTTPASV